MGILTVILLVFFIIIAILLILLVLVQNEEGDGLGGIFGGGAGSAFGSRSGNVLTRSTSVLGALFLIVSLGLALISRTPSVTGIEEEGRRQAIDQEAESSFRDWALDSEDAEFNLESFEGLEGFDFNSIFDNSPEVQEVQ